MKILITGGAGFIGSNIASFLINNGVDVTILDDFSTGNIENIKNLKVELIEGKVEDEDLIKKLAGKNFGTIIHQAAITDTTIKDEDKMMRVNVEGFKNILNLAQEEKAQVIYASSAGVYGNGPVPMRENQKLSPLNAYAFSKVKDDKLTLAFIKENKNIKVIGLRYFNVYGKGEMYKGKSASMIWQLACQMKEGRTPRIFKYGEQKRDFIYIKDVVNAVSKAIEASKSSIVNVGTGIATTFNQIIEILNKILKTNYKPQYFDNPYNFYQNNTQADTNLAYKILGFKAKFNIEEGVKDYFRSFP
jgi:ADP-L-glycero-D-manno-heptose 6-epimerase